MANILKSVFNCTAMSLVIISFSHASTTANKENLRPGGDEIMISPMKSPSKMIVKEANPLVDGIADISSQLQSARETCDFRSIVRASLQFDQMTFAETEWQRMAQTNEALQWPEQDSWKQTVGAHLFFPHDLNVYLDNPLIGVDIERIDMIWSLAAANKYRHPLAGYLLATTLQKLWRSYSDADFPKYYTDLERQSVPLLEQAVDRPDLREVLSKYYLKKAFIKFSGKRVKNIILQEATALSDEAHKLSKTRQYEKAVAKYTEAGDKGLFLGYVAAGGILARQLGFNLNFQTYNGTIPLAEHQETINRMSQYFRQAGEKNIPGGWESLIDLHLAIYEKTENYDDLVIAFRGLRKAGQLGSKRSYADFHRHFKDQYPAFTQEHGAAPQYDLWKRLKSFIEEVAQST